jgi:DNA-binding MarR family transcriptional regulator
VPNRPAAGDDPRRFFWAMTHYRRWLSAVYPTMVGDRDISLPQLSVLYLIRTENASMAEMARQLMVAPTVITGLVDRLEARGLLCRHRDTCDRRRVRLALTPEGERMSIETEARLAALFDQSMAKLTPQERHELSRGLDLLNRVIGDLEEGLDG